MVLASQFNSFLQPAITMLTAPLSFVGAFFALALAGADLSLFAQIAFVALMGLVMKNGILLVDYANQVRERAGSARAAVLEAGPVRLRPVLMTALSTVFGMIPVAISRADGAEWRNPMGILGVGGMLSSTLLTLVVVPVVYTLVDDLRGWTARAWVPLRQRLGAPPRATGPHSERREPVMDESVVDRMVRDFQDRITTGTWQGVCAIDEGARDKVLECQAASCVRAFAELYRIPRDLDLDAFLERMEMGGSSRVEIARRNGEILWTELHGGRCVCPLVSRGVIPLGPQLCGCAAH
jgi:hypothetical protein